MTNGLDRLGAGVPSGLDRLGGSIVRHADTFEEQAPGIWGFIEPSITNFQLAMSPMTVWGVWGAQAVANNMRKNTRMIDVMAENLLPDELANVVHAGLHLNLSDLISGKEPEDIFRGARESALGNIMYLEEHPTAAFSTWGEASRGIWPEPSDIRYASGGPIPILNPSLRGLAGMLPETPEQWESDPAFAAMQRGLAIGANVLQRYAPLNPMRNANMLNDIFIGDWEVGETNLGVTLSTTLMNEQMIAEISNDPLIIWESFMVGKHIANTVAKTAGRGRAAAPFLEWSIGGLADIYDRAVSGATRRVYHLARPIMSDVKWSAYLEYERLLNQQTAIVRSINKRGKNMTNAEKNILWEEINNAVENAPPSVYDPFMEVGETEARAAHTGWGDDIVEAQLTLGEMPDPLDYAKKLFPEMDDETQLIIARTMQDQWILGGKLPEMQRLGGIPTVNWAGDAVHVKHTLTREAREALNKSDPGWEDVLFENPTNVLGDAIVAPAKQRTFRETIRTGNDWAARGDVWAHEGKLLVNPDKVPEGAVRINKLFEDNMFFNAHSRFVRSGRAMGAAQFLREAAGNVALTGEGAGAKTIFEIAEKSQYKRFQSGDYQRTFGALGGDLEDIAKNTKWKDAKTAEDVMQWMMMMQDVGRDPAPWRVVMANTVSAWRALTLTPFMPYHIRNTIGGLNNAFMSGKSDVFDALDAITGARLHPEWDDAFNRAGGNVSGEIRNMAHANMDMGYIRPFDGTPTRSWFRTAFDPSYDSYWGKTVGQAIENHQRRTLYFGCRKRGMSHEDSMDMVYKYLFDYADVPTWFGPGTIPRAISAFPTWTSKNIPIQLEHMWKTPIQFGLRGRVIGQYQKASGDQPTPEWMIEQQGFSIPGPVQEGMAMYFTPENFDPAASVTEWLGWIPPLIQGDMQGARDEVIDMLEDLFNPFVTYPVDITTPVAELGGRGEPTRTVPLSPRATTEGEATGWGFDHFRGKEIYQAYRSYNPLLGGGKMGRGMQHVDYALRKFFRAYNEGSRLLRQYQEDEVSVLPLFGLPFKSASTDQTIYFNLKENDLAIGRIHKQIENQETTAGQADQLRDLYLERLAILGHGTFLQLDPFTGEPRPWLDVAQDGEYTMQGRKDYWRDVLHTTWLLFYGKRTIDSNYIHGGIEMTDQEKEFFAALLDGAIKSYGIVMEEQARLGEVDEEGMPIDIAQEYKDIYGFSIAPPETE